MADRSAVPTVIVWFRRDLRLADHPALARAAAAGRVCPVFVVDDRLTAPSGPNRLAFLADALRSLDTDIGDRLVVRSGDPATMLASLAEEIGAAEVHATDDAGPYGRRRDTDVGESLAARGIAVHYSGTPYAVPPGSILTGGGTPYKVFTPFSRAWEAHGWPAPADAPDVDWVDTGDLAGHLATDGLPEPLASAVATATDLPSAGEAAAWERADHFLDHLVDDYHERRDLPAVDATSRLSAHLKWGHLHPRQLLDRLGDGPGPATFRSELCWREFYADVLLRRPDSARQAFVEKMAAMEVDDGPLADERFAAWAEGRTGYPIVDAGMRQLLAEGWMHNRVRMIVASFLVKDLHVDWTRGARHFMHHLVDGDLASNQHGWQWVAGTGTDASPYFRIFNPTSQGKRFDPEGDYLRRWIPELAHLGRTRIHEPSKDPAGPPAGYPAPVVDHAAERRESLDRYERLKERT